MCLHIALPQRWDSKHTSTLLKREKRESKIVISPENLYAWLSAWEHKAETLKSSNIMRPYLRDAAKLNPRWRAGKGGQACVCVHVRVLCGRQMSTAT